MADLLLLFVLALSLLLLVAGEPPAPLQVPSSTTTRCADKLVSFSPCIPFIFSSPNSISGSPSIQYCDNFAAAFDDNAVICPYCVVHNPPAPLQWPFSSTSSCTDNCKLVSFSPCILIISSSPNNISVLPSIQYCNNFAAAFDDNALICPYCVVHNPPAPLQWPFSSTRSCADNCKLVSFPPCIPIISSSPNNISGSPSIQYCDNFATAIDDNATICPYYIVHNPLILGFPINSTKLISLTSVCSVKEKEGEESLSLDSLCSGSTMLPPFRTITENARSSPRRPSLSPTPGPGPHIPRTGYHDNPAPQEPADSSLPPSSDAVDKPSPAAQATQSASSSTTGIMCNYYCQWLLYAALFFFVVNRRGHGVPPELIPIIVMTLSVICMLRAFL